MLYRFLFGRHNDFTFRMLYAVYECQYLEETGQDSTPSWERVRLEKVVKHILVRNYKRWCWSRVIKNLSRYRFLAGGLRFILYLIKKWEDRQCRVIDID